MGSGTSLAAAAAAQQSELMGRGGGRGLGHRGAAGMRSAGFMAQVNKHVRSARTRRTSDVPPRLTLASLTDPRLAKSDRLSLHLTSLPIPTRRQLPRGR